MTGETITVLIADDHPVYRDGLASLLEPLPGIEVVARAADGIEAVEQARVTQPDVVIMDLQMPRLNGIEATRQVLAELPHTGVLVITMGEDESTVFTAVTAGARGYLLKGADAEEVIQAIRTVHNGGVVFGASLAQRIARVFATGPSARAPEAFPQLSDREREILDLVAAGLSNPDIAARLYLSPKTVRNNVSAILAKLQARDRSAAIIRAREAGLGRASS
ncbi:two-component system response regulator [Microlunatus phosphovorus NM-1]|uniref:Two-component system response regulator n=1 Tax=Microlunatus phosphovorus (strain ATCC 700054 / DSM 10555 / JCM 9379 / NBRC 101784 / NCIMB 13414 / VKM Ac-1990 / NM-1) TaxID=1032480 RepID=F5XKB8_MICPN|nr:response regulator transcription factor [Microlunatus phosphovorus]BAK35990.1 two-component system response regulator [Microlunatus phosphovorus NM-1]